MSAAPDRATGAAAARRRAAAAAQRAVVAAHGRGTVAARRRDRRLLHAHRVTGLAAEAAFFAVLSVPPLIFALAGSIGYVSDQFSAAQVADVRQRDHRPGPARR